MYDIAGRTRRFHLDEEVLPGTHIHPKLEVNTRFANHGRFIARNSSGIWFCAFINSRNVREANFLQLSISRTPDDVGGDFHTPLVLTGDGDRGDAHFPQFGEVENACLLIDGSDRLHVIFGDASGISLLSADAGGNDSRLHLADSSAWTRRQLAEPNDCLGDAVILPDGRLAVYLVRNGALVESVLDGDETVLSEEGEHPNVHIDLNGVRHVAFERDRRIFYTAFDGEVWRDSQGRPGEEMVAYFCSSWPSIATDSRGHIVIAYQGEGKVDLRRHPELYDKLRPGAGSTVSYAVNDGSGWKVHDFLRSSEILLKRRVSSSLPVIGGKHGGFKSHIEEFWRPALSIDVHGVLWMFYLNTTRRHVYFTRFGGETFGDHYEARGAYDCITRNYYVQKDASRSPEIGFMTHAANQMYFDQLEVPTYSSTDERRVVFLDNLELDGVTGIEHCLGKWKKEPGPLEFEGEVEHPLDKHIAWCDVQKTDDGFEMQFMGQGNLRNNWLPGRASSRDGVHWKYEEPYDMSQLSLDGGPFPSVFWRPIYLEDVDEEDPSMRYKGLWGSYKHVDGIEHRTWAVVVSADGLAWRTIPELEPLVVGDISVGFHLKRDDHDKNPQRRYKAMLLMGSHAGRCAVVFTSPDLIHWSRAVWLREDPDNLVSAVSPYSTGPIAIDPDGAENPWEEEIHDAAIWRENGHMMFHYDAFYFHFNQHVEKALAISRDGRHYWRIKRGEINMPHGNCGEWDSGRDRTCDPVRVGDELWMYFCGMPASYFADPEQPDYLTMKHTAWNKPDMSWEVRPWRIGLAKLRVDGWGYLRRERDANEGTITTIPFDYKGGSLVVNGSGLSGLKVAVLEAETQEAIPGFGLSECSFVEGDSVAAPVWWSNGQSLPPGRYRLQFALKDYDVRLYSFGFE